jgi:hypothetical protein
MGYAMQPPRTAPLYTLLFRNGRRLEGQGPLVMAQFRADARLAQYWQETGLGAPDPVSGCDRGG